ncbi:hypothetical protein ACFQX6_14975 [Streptosporangium lutulentum]
MTISDEHRSALTARLSAARRAAQAAPVIPAREATGGPDPCPPPRPGCGSSTSSTTWPPTTCPPPYGCAAR